MLGQFFVTLEHEAPLSPGPMGRAYGIGEGTGLVIADVCDLVLDVLLEFTHRLPDLRDGPLSAPVLPPMVSMSVKFRRPKT